MKWIFRFAMVVMSITTLPYLIGVSIGNSEWVFSGYFFGVEDGNSYIAKMLLGYSGNWLFQTPYSTYEQNGFLAFLPYILLGKLAGGANIHEQLICLFQLFRWIAGIFVIYATYNFLSKITNELYLRKWGTVIGSLGGGLGWMFFLGFSDIWQNRIPLEFYSPETFGFLSLLGIPHLAASRGLLLLAIGDILYAEHTSNHRISAIKPGIYLLLSGFFQPLTIVTGWAILMAFLLGRILKSRNDFSGDKKGLSRIISVSKKYIITILISSPWVIYNYVSFQIDPYLLGWYDQNIILSPPIRDYLIAFLPIILFTIWKSKNLKKNISVITFQILCWMAIFPILAYAPYNLQRRLPDAIWICLISLSILSLKNDDTFKTKILRSGFLGSSLFTSLIIISGSLGSVLSPVEPVFLTRNQVVAFQSIPVMNWEIVIADFESSNALPAWIACRVVFGHGPESINSHVVENSINRLFSETRTQTELEQIINGINADFILVDVNGSGSYFSLMSTSPALEVIYENSSYIIYYVNRNED